jgi:Flp pilus assembly secretin CpaC
MMLLDVLKGVKPRRRVRFGSIIAGATILASLGAALPAITPLRQDAQSALVEMLTSGKRSKEMRPIIESSDAFLSFAKDISRVAVGNPEVIKLSTSDKRNLVLNGGSVGRTSLTVWFEGGVNEQFMVSVVRDLSVLEAALRAVHPNVHVEIAPDRDAVVLSGNVPDTSYAARAEAAAVQYIAAGGSRGKTEQAEIKNTGQVINLIRSETAPTSLERRIESEITRQGGKNVHVTRVVSGGMPNDAVDVFVIEGEVATQRAIDNVRNLLNGMVPDDGDQDAQQDNPRVVNRMTTTEGVLELEQIIQKAIREQVGCPKVTVSRVNDAQFRGEADILVLKGSVPSQTKLTQALALASRLFLQQQLVKDKLEGQFEDVTETFAGGNTRNTRRPLQLKSAQEDIKVAGDESGALRNSGNASGGSRAGRAIGRLRSSTSTTSGGSGGSFGDLLGNLIESNIGRATALELANGRILSFLTVDDLPQVRVDIRFLDINRTALLNWDSDLSVKVTDFEQQSTIPHDYALDSNGFAQPVGLNPGATSNAEVENVLGFLGGGLANALHISGDHVDIKSLFRLLESEGLSKTLSSPSLTVLSGELASFGVGGSIPVESSVLAASGIATTEVEFIDFGINLSVRPLVGEDGFITLDIVPEVSNPDASLTAQLRLTSGTNPATTAFSTRVLRTSSRLRDGQTLLIGGLTEHSRQDDTSQTPWLHNVPILGWFFKDFSYADGDHELVIMLSPVIVRDAPDEVSLWAFPTGIELMKGPKDARTASAGQPPSDEAKGSSEAQSSTEAKQ